MSVQSDLAELYTAFYNRAPDAAGLAYWVNELNNGNMTLESIARNWEGAQPETQEKYPDTLSVDDFIEAIYGNVFSRSSDAEGAAYWKAGLENGSLSRDSFIAAVLNGAKANTSTQGLADAALVNNKAQVGVAFAEKGLNDTALAAKVLTSVSANTDTLNATLDLIKLIPASTAAQTPALLTLVSSTLDKVAALVKGAPGELSDLATYLNAVVTGTGSTTNLTTLFTSINTKAGAALTNPSALDNPAAQAGSDVVTATPTTGEVAVFAVTQTAPGLFTVGSQNGNVSLYVDGSVFTFKPANGTAVDVDSSLITSGLVVNSVSLVPSSDAFSYLMAGVVIGGIKISGSGTLVVPQANPSTLIESRVADISLSLKQQYETGVEQITSVLDLLDIRVDYGVVESLGGNATQIVDLYARNDVIGLGKVDLFVTDEYVPLATLVTIDAKTTGALQYQGVTGTLAQLKASIYVKADINVLVTDLPTTSTGLEALAAKIGGEALIAFNLTSVAQLKELSDLKLTTYWTGTLVDTATNLLTVSQGDTRNVDVTLTNNDAGTLTVQQRSDLAKMLAYVDDSDWKFNLKDTAEHLLASHAADPDIFNFYVRTVTVNDNAELSLAEVATLKSLTALNFEYTVVDTLANLTANQGEGLVNGYVIADTVVNLENAITSSDPVFAGKQGYYVADTVEHVQQWQSEEGQTPVTPNGYILVDTVSNLLASKSSSTFTDADGYKISGDLTSSNLSIEEAKIVAKASNSNDYINKYSVSGSVTEAEGLDNYTFKYASSVTLSATTGEDTLSGNLTDGHLNIVYSSGAQADHFVSPGTGVYQAVDGNFDSFSFLYGSPSIPDRDHIDVLGGTALAQSFSGNVTDNTYTFVKGSYNALDGKFTQATYGTDTLVAWDSDTSNVLDAVAIVLVGQSPNNASEIVNFSLKLVP
ncbi:outer membrane adhesin-like protein [Paucimonas lemoignei]|nr:outer membrane adhesin-like protein [Paucimonas lemoignei]